MRRHRLKGGLHTQERRWTLGRVVDTGMGGGHREGWRTPARAADTGKGGGHREGRRTPAGVADTGRGGGHREGTYNLARMPNYSVYELLNKKRRGGPLDPREIEFFVEGFTRGTIAEYQMS